MATCRNIGAASCVSGLPRKALRFSVKGYQVRLSRLVLDDVHRVAPDRPLRSLRDCPKSQPTIVVCKPAGHEAERSSVSVSLVTGFNAGGSDMRTFHFDMRNIDFADDLQVTIHGTSYPLTSHSSKTLRSTLNAHPCIGILPAGAVNAFSHFVEVDEDLFPRDAVGWLRVERRPKSGVHLPQVVMIKQHIPEDHLRAYYQETLEFYKQPL